MRTNTVYNNLHLEVQTSRTLLFLIKFLQRQMVRKNEHRIHVAWCILEISNKRINRFIVYGIMEYIQSISTKVFISSIIIKVELKLDFYAFLKNLKI